MTVRVDHSLGDLSDDLARIARQSRSDLRETVQDGIRAGRAVAQGYARTSNPPGSHARKYPNHFAAEMHSGAGLFGNVISGEYGPNPRGQGLLGLILENGTRNGNRPQQNMARSAHLIGPTFAAEVRTRAAGWFW